MLSCEWSCISVFCVLSPLCAVAPPPEAAEPLPARSGGAPRRLSAVPWGRPAPPPQQPPPRTAQSSYPPEPPAAAAPPGQSQIAAEETSRKLGYMVLKQYPIVPIMHPGKGKLLSRFLNGGESCVPTSPSSIWVSTSLPDLAGMKSGVEGLSRKSSVWHSTSVATMTLLSSSR